MSIRWKQEIKKINELTPWEKNPRQITKDQVEQLEKSLSKFGLCEPLVINLDNKIIGGHQRYQILKKRKYKEIAVFVPDRLLTEHELEELALRLNKNEGDWDLDTLANEFEIDQLLDVGFSLDEIGLSDAPEKPQKKSEPTMTIKFRNRQELEEAEILIAPLLEKWKGAFYRLKF